MQQGAWPMVASVVTHLVATKKNKAQVTEGKALATEFGQSHKANRGFRDDPARWSPFEVRSRGARSRYDPPQQVLAPHLLRVSLLASLALGP